MGSNEKKRQRERFLLDQFLEQHGITPKSIQQPSPPNPDFLIDLDGRRIGIELTEIFVRPDNSRNYARPAEKPLLQEFETATDRIVSKAREIYFEADNPLVLSKIVFSSQITLDKKKHTQIAQLIADKIRDMSSRNLPEANWRPGVYENEAHLLSQSVAFIHIRRVPESRFARWIVARAGIVARLTPQLLQDRIDQKAKKINGYQENKNIDEIWLLMVADRRRPSQKVLLPSELPLRSVSSPFAKTFYYCYAADESVVEL